MLETRQGDHLNGHCISINNGKVNWVTLFGGSVAVPIQDVRTLETEGLWDLEMKDGSVIRAKWGVTDNGVIIQSSVLGTLHCTQSALQAATASAQAKGLEDQSGAPKNTPSESVAPAPANAVDKDNLPPPSSLQTLLRESTILLMPKQWNLSAELRYTHDRQLYAANDARQLQPILRAQVGITSRWEAGLALPASWTRTKTTVITSTGTSATSTTTSKDKYYVGDPEIQSAFLLCQEKLHRPEILAVGGLTVPVNSSDRGGQFRSRLGLECVQVTDPCALFAGVAWQHDYNGWQRSRYQPVDYFTYHLGVAAGFNDELAIGFEAQGGYRSPVRDRAGNLVSLSSEPVFGRFWFNYRLDATTSAEPSVIFPANDDAHATTFSFTFIKRY